LVSENKFKKNDFTYLFGILNQAILQLTLISIIGTSNYQFNFFFQVCFSIHFIFQWPTSSAGNGVP